jgi:Arc/MetJ-type ribon-helix-helix transcriptional regulator
MKSVSKGATAGTMFRLGPEVLASLDELVAAARDPMATRSSVLRTLIVEAAAKVAKRKGRLPKLKDGGKP